LIISKVNYCGHKRRGHYTLMTPSRITIWGEELCFALPVGLT